MSTIGLFNDSWLSMTDWPDGVSLHSTFTQKKKKKRKIDLTIKEIFKDGWIYKLIEIS